MQELVGPGGVVGVDEGGGDLHHQLTRHSTFISRLIINILKLIKHLNEALRVCGKGTPQIIMVIRYA